MWLPLQSEEIVNTTEAFFLLFFLGLGDISFIWVHALQRTHTHTKSLFYVSFSLFFVFISAAASLGIQILSSKAQDLFFNKRQNDTII